MKSLDANFLNWFNSFEMFGNFTYVQFGLVWNIIL